MHTSIRVRALLDEIIDYAGLFPPAQLPLEEALRIFLHECETSPHSRMLRSFVCPATRLPDLLALTKLHRHPLPVAALGQSSPQVSDFLPQIEADVQAIEKYRRGWLDAAPPEPGDEQEDEDNFAAAQRGYAGIHTYEVALPKGLAGNLLVRELKTVGQLLLRAKLFGYLEIPRTENWRLDVEDVCQSIDTWGRKAGVRGLFGLKLRCGGLTPEAFPSDAQVAYFLDRCRVNGLRWKATAGLHHPRPHWDPALQRWHHGFLNVFAAAVLAWHNAVPEADLVEIVADREAQHFRFEDNGFAWKTWACTGTQVAEARRDFAMSFGSCSFAEPCADLVALGLLE